MNQTRLLIAVVLLLAGAFGYVTWSQQNQLRTQGEKQDKLLEALLGNKSASTAPAAAGTSGAAAGNGANPAPAVTPEGEATSEQKRMALLETEMKRMREENENLKVQGDAATEERDRLTGELEAAKFQIDQRMAQIRSAPMLARVTNVVAEHGIIVISAGRNSGIEPKDEFSIRRAGKIICQIRISDSLDDAQAAADPVPGSMAPDESVKEGDEVVKLD